MNPLFSNQLNQMLTGGYQGTPGFQFALDTGLQAVDRSNSRQRGSGNALAALTKYGTGLAQQDYGNQMDRLGRLQGQEQQFALGRESNSNQFQLGQAQNATTNQRDFWNYDLGRESNAMTAARDRNQFDLTSNQRGRPGGMYQQNWNMGQQNRY
jgi:hypothetical protein